jgi:hypothetical protein
MKLSTVLDLYLPDTVLIEMWVSDDRSIKNRYSHFKYNSDNWNKIYLYRFDIKDGSDTKTELTYTTVCEIDANLQVNIIDNIVMIYYPDRPTYIEYLKFYKKQLISLSK